MKKLFVIFLVLTSLRTFSQFNEIVTPGALKSLKKTDYGVLIKAEHATLQIFNYANNVVRFRMAKELNTDDFSYAVIQKPAGNFQKIDEQKDFWQLLTDSLTIEIGKSPLYIRIKDSRGNILSEDYEGIPVTWQGTEVTANKKLFADEKFIGLGEKTGPLNRRGEKYENWNTDAPAYLANQDPLYNTIPFYMGIHGTSTYGIFLDNSFRTKFNFGASTDDQFSSFSAANGELNYYFFGATTIAGIISDYTWLTGRIKMPPYWSLGYQQCRWSYYPETEVLSIAQSFRDKKIPCDVLYLDIDYMDSYKIFTWNNTKFPDPKGMISKLNSMGFHLVTIVDPGIKVEKGYHSYEEGVAKDYFVKYPGGKLYIGSVWPGRCHFPDFTKEATRNWWGNSFKALIDPGVEGFWNDMN
ncbi:MAG: TIM-barrel domain-containing protein, partial [Bacteroidota bacterium]